MGGRRKMGEEEKEGIRWGEGFVGRGKIFCVSALPPKLGLGAYTLSI